MRLAIDIDGVVAEFADECNRWLAAEGGQPLQPVNSWDWYKQYGRGVRLWGQFWAMLHDNPGWLWELMPVPGAVEHLHRLNELGHEIEFVTARSVDFEEVTRTWLDCYSLGRFPLTMESRKWLTGHDLYLDDHIENVQACRARGRGAVLFLREHNFETWKKASALDPLCDAVVDWRHFMNLVEALDAA